MHMGPGGPVTAKRVCPTHEIAHPVGGACPYCPDPDETKPFGLDRGPVLWRVEQVPGRGLVLTRPTGPEEVLEALGESTDHFWVHPVDTKLVEGRYNLRRPGGFHDAMIRHGWALQPSGYWLWVKP